MKAKDRLIFALDVQDMEAAISFLDKLEGKVGLVKVNSLAAAYPKIVPLIRERGIGVWRDWKHHDIPGTVKNFIIADVEAKIDMTTVHALGGTKMMEYAVEGVGVSDLKILGITILTSHSQDDFNQELGIPGPIHEKVSELALRAEKAGLTGVVSSAREVEALRRFLKPDTLIVTPGIKPEWAARRADQSRVTTPYQAIEGGADYIVVGSAIHNSQKYNRTPEEAAESIVSEIDKALSDRNI